ncbi:hypothetical protein D8674_026248 [Pyrus ussuriensis x Pyrus communis]|uniref:Retrotransposon Copia-like N-terminal domain-containing protein n=1 Tax=Pyrus ussuriensis x Pyrus communis TaxID=2448454 RepID=A0A5N5IKT9_9ROSA|nr:hypothetical protein D8674_026248 [Pyrus ussuriensis x Pyrus communis]
MAPFVKIEGLLAMLTIRLGEHNYTKWSFQFKSVLKGYKLFDHFDGSVPCPSKFVVSVEIGVTKELIVAFQDWETTDLSLLSLLIATLTDDAIEYVIGCKTAAEAWTNLEEMFASVSRTEVNHLKMELHTVQKGGDSMDKYLLRIKSIRDQLMATREYVSDNDAMIAAPAGLPKEYATIRTAILARDSNVTMKEFRALLIGAERENDVVMNSLTQNMAALHVQGNSGGSSSSLYNNGASSVITATPLPQQMPFFPQSQMVQPAYFPNQSSYGSGGDYVGNLEQHPQDSRQHQSSAQFNGNQQGFYNGGQSKGNRDIMHWNVIIGEITPTNPLGLLLLLHLHFLLHPPAMQGMNAQQNIHAPDLSYQVQPAMQGMNVQGSPSYSNAAKWIVDIGASHHITSDLTSLHQVSSFEGAICYNLQTHKLILSRHVVHDESLFPVKCKLSVLSSSRFVPYSINSTLIIIQLRASIQSMSDTTSQSTPQRQESGTQKSESLSSHQSTPIQDLKQPLSPILDPAHLQVLLPISLSDWNQSSSSVPANNSRTHSMTTRLQTGAIERRDYAAFYASLLELQSLEIDDGSLCYDGFSLLAESVDYEEPKNFKVAATNSNWQQAMQDEFDALKGLHEPGMLSSQDMGRPTYFLGLHIQHKSNGDMFITGMENCRPAPTPSKPHTQLLISEGADIHISAYSDADWASDINTKMSVTRYVSKNQSSVSRSSIEAEYKALANCAADVVLGVITTWPPTVTLLNLRCRPQRLQNQSEMRPMRTCYARA